MRYDKDIATSWNEGMTSTKKRGRPPLGTIKPKPTSWRPDSEFIKAEYKRLGGSRWLNATIAAIIKDKAQS